MEKAKIENRLLIIAGSAGSLEVILEVLPKINIGFCLPIIIVLHRKSDNDFLLQQLLSTKTYLKVKEAEEKDIIEPATIYIAPADYHLLIERDHSFSLDYSEKVNHSRPSIDVTFQSAADVYGKHLTCILLSGANSDGSNGLKYLKEKGGLAIVQQPESALVPYMPQQAILNNAADLVLDNQGIASYINSLC